MSSDETRPEGDAAEPAPDRPRTGDDDVTPQDLASATPARGRRAPRFPRFIAAGVLLGLVIAAVLTWLTPPPAGTGRATSFLLLGLTLALVLGLAGAIAAVIADRRSR